MVAQGVRDRSKARPPAPRPIHTVRIEAAGRDPGQPPAWPRTRVCRAARQSGASWTTNWPTPGADAMFRKEILRGYRQAGWAPVLGYGAKGPFFSAEFGPSGPSLEVSVLHGFSQPAQKASVTCPVSHSWEGTVNVSFRCPHTLSFFVLGTSWTTFPASPVFVGHVTEPCLARWM